MSPDRRARSPVRDAVPHRSPLFVPARLASVTRTKRNVSPSHWAFECPELRTRTDDKPTILGMVGDRRKRIDDLRTIVHTLLHRILHTTMVTLPRRHGARPVSAQPVGSEIGFVMAEHRRARHYGCSAAPQMWLKMATAKRPHTVLTVRQSRHRGARSAYSDRSDSPRS